MSDLIEFIEFLALQNAVKYKGKANPKALIGPVVAKYPEQKAQMKDLMTLISDVVSQVNDLDLSVQEEKLTALSHHTVEKKKKQEGLRDLDAVDEKVVMRFAPSPSGPMHIGHAFTGGLSSLYVDKYKGEFVLRIEDTNSDKIDVDAYEMLEEDGNWVFGNVTSVVIQSDRMDLYYKYARDMIASGAIYVCTCTQDEFKEYVQKQHDCPCKTKKDHATRFDNMFDAVNGYKAGEVVVRAASGMGSNNPAMRDFPLFRINDSTHPRQGDKYRVWPLMNFSVFVDDVELGITHVIRAKDHADNARRQEFLYAAINAKPPVSYFTGKYHIEGLEVSASKTKAKIVAGEYEGWQDIRIPFLQPLRRRGYQPGAFKKYAEQVGLSKVDKVISVKDFFATLDAYNKDIIDSIATRHYIISESKHIHVDGFSEDEYEISLHPSKDLGVREFQLDGDFLIEKNDYDEQSLIRLMDVCNIIFDNGWKVHSISYDDFKSYTGLKKIIHWLPADDDQLIEFSIRMPDNSLLSVQGEKSLLYLSEDAIVQFERFGFCRLDSTIEGLEFWFGHK